jgi:hypothetical protein
MEQRRTYLTDAEIDALVGTTCLYPYDRLPPGVSLSGTVTWTDGRSVMMAVTEVIRGEPPDPVLDEAEQRIRDEPDWGDGEPPPRIN